MRKIIILLLITLVLLLSGVVFAQEQFTVRNGGETLNVRTANIQIDGKSPPMEAPAYVYQGRTLVPIRFIAEGMGATVDWIDETRTVIIKSYDKLIAMNIDSEIVQVNNEVLTLDKESIPRLITFNKMDKYPNAGSRTMVPVRFVSEILGYNVEWDQNAFTVLIDSKHQAEMPTQPGVNQVVNKINYETSENKTIVSVDGINKISHTSMYIDSTNKIVIDIKDSLLDIGSMRDTPGNLFVDSELVERVQYSQFSISPYSTRVVVTLNKKANYKILLSNNDRRLQIVVDGDTQNKEVFEDEDIEEGVITSSRIELVSVVKDSSNKEFVFLNGLDSLNYSTFTLTNPDRFVVDIKDAVIDKDKAIAYETNIIGSTTMRLAQFSRRGVAGGSEDIVRIVFDIRNRDLIKNLSIEKRDGMVAISEESGSWGNLIHTYNENKTSLFLYLNNSLGGKHTYQYDAPTKTLMVELDYEHPNIPNGRYDVFDGFFKSVEVKKENSKTLMFIDFSRNVTIKNISSSSVFSFEINPDNNVSVGKKTIVIDPGHGGRDPGAISVDGQHEKTYNLTLSFMLRARLEALGYNVLMTREADTWVELLDRPAFANSVNADLFLSIHANANIKPEIRGLEVIYCPANECPNKSVDQYPLAKMVYDNITKLTGDTQGRGIVKGPRYIVINRTTMPSLIIESGYLTNREENALIWTQTHMEMMVSGIANGIVEYFNNY